MYRARLIQRRTQWSYELLLPDPEGEDPLTCAQPRASYSRSLESAENTFANESFLDELATVARVDVAEFRMFYLTDPRLRAVLRTAAEKVNGDSCQSP